MTDAPDVPLPDKQHSYRLDGYQAQTYPKLTTDITCDVAIVGKLK